MNQAVTTRGEAVRAFLDWAGAMIEAGRHEGYETFSGEDLSGHVAEGYAILQAEIDSLADSTPPARYFVFAMSGGTVHTIEPAATFDDAWRIAKDFRAEGSLGAIVSALEVAWGFAERFGGVQ